MELRLAMLESVKPKTEEFLYLLLWSAETLIRPTFRNLDESFESWAYRNGFLKQIALLEKARLIDRKSIDGDKRIYRLTDKGRLRALHGRDPETWWGRHWDGRWRMVLFDVPVLQNTERSRLRRFLRERGFGYLQNSVWITPDPLNREMRELNSITANVESLIVFEGRPCAGESDLEIVVGAWNFDRINSLYHRHLKILSSKPAGKLTTRAQAQALRNWAKAEREAWWEAIGCDPLLPENLLPSKYLGRRSWRRRVKVLEKARRDLDTFDPAKCSITR